MIVNVCCEDKSNSVTVKIVPEKFIAKQKPTD